MIADQSSGRTDDRGSSIAEVITSRYASRLGLVAASEQSGSRRAAKHHAGQRANGHPAHSGDIVGIPQAGADRGVAGLDVAVRQRVGK